MRMLAWWIVVSGSIAGIAAGQEATPAAAPLKSYVVEVARYHLDNAAGDPRIDELMKESPRDRIKAVQRLRHAGKLKLLDQVLLPTIAGRESSAQIGQRVNVSTDEPTTGPIEPGAHVVGKLCHVTAVPQDETVVLELNYEVTRLVRTPKRSEHQIASVRRVIDNGFMTTIRLKHGEQDLIGGVTTHTRPGDIVTTVLVVVSLTED